MSLSTRGSDFLDDVERFMQGWQRRLCLVSNVGASCIQSPQARNEDESNIFHERFLKKIISQQQYGKFSFIFEVEVCGVWSVYFL